MVEYIKCEKAVEILKQKSLKMFNNYYKGYMQAIKDLIDECPAADVEPVRRGHWIINSDGYYPQCSECMNEPQGRVMTDWCPNCGAKMGGKENGK